MRRKLRKPAPTCPTLLLRASPLRYEYPPRNSDTRLQICTAPSPYQTVTSQSRSLHCPRTKSYTKVTDVYQSINAQVAFRPPQNPTQLKPGTPSLPQTLHRIDITPSMSPTCLNTYQPNLQYPSINTLKNAPAVVVVVASTATCTPYHRIFPHESHPEYAWELPYVYAHGPKGKIHAERCTQR